MPEYFLTSYDALGTGVYIMEDGTYYLTAADNSHEAANNILAAKGYTTADGMTSEGNASMTYTMDYTFDAQTYAQAYGTGNDVTSLFASADINRYEGKGDNSVTYVSRSNWEGTLMLWADENEDGENDNYVKLSMTDQMYQDTILDAADIPANDDQWPVMGSDETSYSLIQLLQNEDGSEIAYDDPMWEDLLNQLTYEDMSRLCAVGLRMTVSLESIGKPETLDHNGPSGVTQKYSAGPNGYANQTNDPDKEQTGTCYPCNGILAATMNDQLVQEVGELIGEDAMWAGYAGFYGSGLNIHRTPYAGRVFEYYSEDGILTGLIDTYETIGIQSKGVYVYNKHFALNDQELQRQGLGTWCNEQAMREIYLRAFELPIVNADAKCVMTAFNRIGAVWSGACSELLTDWLRGEAGMTGFAVTDMYEGDYMSKPHEVLAGNDIPDNFPGTTGTGVDTASSGDLGYSEYGCEGMPNLHSSKPRRGDHTEEYQAIYHEFMLKCFQRHPYMWSTHVWNMFDFAADARDQGGEPGMNHKGLVTFDRKTKKDSFYLYKAYWSEEPFVHLCGSRYTDRTEQTTTVKVYSNQSEVSLYANGKLVEKKTGDKVFTFKVPLSGQMKLEARAGKCRDTILIRRVEKPNDAYRLKKGKSSSANWV